MGWSINFTADVKTVLVVATNTHFVTSCFFFNGCLNAANKKDNVMEIYVKNLGHYEILIQVCHSIIYLLLIYFIDGNVPLIETILDR